MARDGVCLMPSTTSREYSRESVIDARRAGLDGVREAEERREDAPEERFFRSATTYLERVSRLAYHR